MTSFSYELIEKIDTLLDGISPTPWINNGYSGIASGPLLDQYNQQEALIPDNATDADERWNNLPDVWVAHVPATAGDTSTGCHYKDMQLISEAPLVLKEARGRIKAQASRIEILEALLKGKSTRIENLETELGMQT